MHEISAIEENKLNLLFKKTDRKTDRNRVKAGLDPVPVGFLHFLLQN